MSGKFYKKGEVSMKSNEPNKSKELNNFNKSNKPGKPNKPNELNYRKIMRDLREDADLTQQDVANYLGTSQTMYARYECGANELPIHHMEKLCEMYDVSADYFLGRNRGKR